MSQAGFREDFLWGTATASYQVEGAVAEGGRTPSIWDTFAHTPGKVVHGHSGDRASDGYHRYKEDVALMKELGVGAYRFSVAWPRIFPSKMAKGAKPNPAGVDYYNRLIDELKASGIRPAVTLYHWDLPQYLEDEGGWRERDTAYRFAEYARACFEAFGDRVDLFITLNEPWCSTFLGHLEGVHAPGLRDRPAAYRVLHHLMLAHGLAVEAYRSTGASGQIGITLNINTPRPATRRAEDVSAADRACDRDARMFLDPIFGRGYPSRHLKAYPEVAMPVEGDDLKKIGVKIDFIGLNYYTERAVAHDDHHPEHFRQVTTGYPTTDMGWDIVPDGLARQLLWVHRNYPVIPLYVTENGCAAADTLSDDGTRCHDGARIDYLRSHFRALKKAVALGVDLRGYFLWSFVDNFEWAQGYTKRFGIVYCDYTDQRRIPKDSFYYYREVIAGHEE